VRYLQLVNWPVYPCLGSNTRALSSARNAGPRGVAAFTWRGRCSGPLRTVRRCMGHRDRAGILGEYGGGLLHQSDRRTQCETWIMLMQMIASADAIGHWNSRSSAMGARTYS
jgi:hypothetical protein